MSHPVCHNPKCSLHGIKLVPAMKDVDQVIVSVPDLTSPYHVSFEQKVVRRHHYEKKPSRGHIWYDFYLCDTCQAAVDMVTSSPGTGQ